MPAPAARRLVETTFPLIRAGDPVVTPLGLGAALADAFALLEADTRRSLWNMQTNVRLSASRLMHHLDESSRRRGVEERSLYPAHVVSRNPLLTTFDPGLRVSRVPTGLIVVDERYAVLSGPSDIEDAIAWGTDDPDLVRLARDAFLEAWEASVPWREAGLPVPREPLPARRFRIVVLLADGHTDREIAAELGVSERTVSAEVRAVVDWVGARNRTHAVAMLVGAA